MKCSLGISNLLEKISSLSHSVVFPLFLCIDHWRRLSYLFLLFFGTLHSDAYIFPFLLCFSLLFFSQLFVRPPQTAILLLLHGSDHELLIAKFRLKLNKVGKTTRPFRYDLNQIPYDYTVEVRNRFKGQDLIDRVPDELWNEVLTLYRRQGSRPSPWKRNAKKQNGCLGRPYK